MSEDRKRVCLLTGASGRLGSAFCSMYASTYDIVAVYRSKPLTVASQDQTFVDPLAPSRELEENRHKVFAVQADLSQDREIERVAELALTRFGRIDLLVNAAAYSVWAPIMESSLLSSAAYQFRLNTVAPLQLAATISRTFWRNKVEENIAFNRNVVNIASTAGLYMYPDTGQSVYSATKAALIHLTYHMASELWSIGIRVNATAPNAFPSIVPLQRAAQAIVELDQAEVTGKVLVSDADARYL